MANGEDHGRVMQSTMNKRPDGITEFRFVYEDGYQPPMGVEQGAPPVEGEKIHSEMSVQPDGSVSYFEQFEGGKTHSFVMLEDGTIVNDHEEYPNSEDDTGEDEPPQPEQPENPEPEEPEHDEPEHDEPEHEEPEHDEPEHDEPDHGD